MHDGGRSARQRSCERGSAARRGRDCRSAVQARRPRLGAGLPRRRPRDRSLRPAAVLRPAGDPARRRTRRGDVPLPHRARDAAVPLVEPARGDFRPWRGAGRYLWRAAYRRGHPRRPRARSGLHRRDGLRALVDRDRDADPGRTRRRFQPARPAHRFHPAAGRPRHRAAARTGRLHGAGGGWERALAGRRPRPRLGGGVGARRPLPAQPDVPRARCGARAK